MRSLLKTLAVILNRGVTVLLEEMDNDDDENVWLSEVNAEGCEEQFPR